MIKNWVRLLLIATVLGVSVSGCAGWFESACTKALPLLNQGDGLINDAQDALLQAEAMVEHIRDDDARAKAKLAAATAREKLRRAEALLHAASQACTAPDLPSIFKVFADAWDLLKPFLGTMGAEGGVVRDPVAYGIGKRG